MVQYLIQVVICQLVFLLAYDLLFKKQTFFNWNRLYLMASSVIALVLPLLKIEGVSSLGRDMGVIALPEIVLGNLTQEPATITELIKFSNPESSSAVWPIWQIILLSGMGISALFFLARLVKLDLLKSNNPHRWTNNILLIQLKNSNQAFSFFNAIFIGSDISKTDQELIINHEMVHVKQYHSLDILWMQLLRIVFWFNPLVYAYQKRLVELHEFVADQQSVQAQGKASYYENLLRQTLQVTSVALTNAFFSKSLIKKRIQMLQQQPSSKSVLSRFLLVIPVVLSLLFYVSCEQEIAQDEMISSQDLEALSVTYTRDNTEDELPVDVQSKLDEIRLFLMRNTEYVQWIDMNFSTKITHVSVHHKDEKPSFEYMTINTELSDGSSRPSYFNMDRVKEHGLNEGQKIRNGEVYDQSEIPFSVVDQVPTYQSCDHLSGEERKRCTTTSVSKFVNENFNTNLAKEYGLTGRMRISVFFKIDSNGDVVEVGARAAHEVLATEAKRVIAALPKFIPGVHNGESVTVPYSLPILFQVNE